MSMQLRLCPQVGAPARTPLRASAQVTRQQSHGRSTGQVGGAIASKISGRSPRVVLPLRAAQLDGQSASGAAAPVSPATVPSSAEATAEQAAGAILRAWRDGIKRQQIQYLLPLIGATDLDDWPGGIRQQFKAAAPMLESMLVGLKKEQGLQGKLQPSILDDGDAVGCWASEGLAAVLFPTAETLKEVRSLVEARPQGLSILANPQWTVKGQIVSDFGWGPWKARNEELVGSFKQTYCFKQMRVLGEDVRILYSYPGKWQVHVQEEDGSTPLAWSGDTMPPYTELEAVLRKRPGSKASMTWLQRLESEIEFNRKSMENEQ